MGACGDLAEPTVDAVRLFDCAGMASQEAQGLWDLFVSGETEQDGEAAASVVFPNGSDPNRMVQRVRREYGGVRRECNTCLA